MARQAQPGKVIADRSRLDEALSRGDGTLSCRHEALPRGDGTVSCRPRRSREPPPRVIAVPIACGCRGAPRSRFPAEGIDAHDGR